MANITRTQNDFYLLLGEQLEFLKLSCASFDNGFEGEIKRLAVSVRVLVHDTGASTSLLALSNRKNISFLDTSEPYDDENLLSHSSLVQIHMSLQGAKPKAHLDDVAQPSSIPFDAWWNGIVLVDSKKNEFSRKDIVLYLANKDGGAHVEHEIDEKYHNLRTNNALGWITVTSLEGGREIAGEDHIPATMRQIAHELIKSLDTGYSCSRPVGGDKTLVVSGMSVTVGAHSLPDQKFPNLRKDRPIIGGKKIGRNAPCPCGSRKKFKKCCI
jgi:SEC-C motif